eukprot:gb/GECH01012685.1/.p1 GENE.gb/GECH01012685.1/~~gb/GECH01012685.1/.p1  ORF type:complete len:381 (+),score=151.74 gb/GECH01012685.1/:1-1143(+)
MTQDKNFQLSPQEMKRLEECFKKPEFMDLLQDYAKELQDPETLEEYSKYLDQIEREQAEGKEIPDYMMPPEKRKKKEEPKEEPKHKSKVQSSRTRSRGFDLKTKPPEQETKPSIQEVETRRRFIEPECKIIYRGEFDMKDYLLTREHKKRQGIPQELSVIIQLPKLSSVKDVDLEISEQTIFLTCDNSEAKYKLEKDLPFKIDEEEGNAKFDKPKRQLNILLPVIPPPKKEEEPNETRNDSNQPNLSNHDISSINKEKDKQNDNNNNNDEIKESKETKETNVTQEPVEELVTPHAAKNPSQEEIPARKEKHVKPSKEEQEKKMEPLDKDDISSQQNSENLSDTNRNNSSMRTQKTKKNTTDKPNKKNNVTFNNKYIFQLS